MAMKHLASDPERRAGIAREIAEHDDVPIELMARVLTRLVPVGFARLAPRLSQRLRARLAACGDLGGGVLEAMDGPLTLTAWAHGDLDCDQFSKCVVRDPLRRIGDRIAAILTECSILQIVADPASLAPPARAMSLPAMRRVSALQAA